MTTQSNEDVTRQMSRGYSDMVALGLKQLGELADESASKMAEALPGEIGSQPVMPPITIYAKVWGQDQEGEHPNYCEFKLDHSKLSEIARAAELCRLLNLESIRLPLGPDRWLPTADVQRLRMETRGTVVNKNSFYFEAYSMKEDHDVYCDRILLRDIDQAICTGQSSVIAMSDPDPDVDQKEVIADLLKAEERPKPTASRSMQGPGL